MSDFLSSNVTVMISNMDISIKFYTETLGLKLKTGLANIGQKLKARALSLDCILRKKWGAVIIFLFRLL